MKRLYIAVGLVVFCLSLGIFECVSICSNTEKCIKNIEKIDECVKDNKYEKAIEICNDTSKDYKKITSGFIYCYYPHSSLEEVGTNLCVMTETLKNKDINRYKSMKEKTKKQLLAIKEEELFTIQNIL